MTEPEKVYLSWEEVSFICRTYGEKLKAENRTPSTIIAIGQGGLIPATILSKATNCKTLYNIGVSTRDGYNQKLSGASGIYQWIPSFPAPKKPIILVDDLWDTGYTLSIVDGELKKTFSTEIYDSFRYFTMLRGTKHPISDLFKTKIETGQDFDNTKWVVFPWE